MAIPHLTPVDAEPLNTGFYRMAGHSMVSFREPERHTLYDYFTVSQTESGSHSRRS
jgi:hypothetical protein